jgi:CRP-like cAMP-binding protein
VYTLAVASLDPEEKRELLAAVPIFAGLGARELDALVQLTRAVRVAAREEIFHKGDRGAQLYVVACGSVKAVTTSADGNDVVFGIMGPGEVFGEIALLSENERSATIVAVDACELLVLDRRDFLAFLKSHSDAAIQMLGLLAERMRRLSELVEDTQFLKLPVRLAKKLGALAARYGAAAEDGGIRIELKLSQEEWGDLVGATREAVNKQLRAWTEEGLVQMDGGYVWIRRPEALEKLARFAIS